jgi:uncharacterized membrane protein YhaH (DUF805 family)
LGSGFLDFFSYSGEHPVVRVLGLVFEGLFFLFLLAHVVPAWAVMVRRLHDTNMSGWWALTSLIPILGGLLLLVPLVKKGTPGENRFGPDPLSFPKPLPFNPKENAKGIIWTEK